MRNWKTEVPSPRMAAGRDSAMYSGTTTQSTPPARPISRRPKTSE